MGLFTGKKGLVFGIANDYSIAWAITQELRAEGAEMAFTHLPDKEPSRPRMERRLRKLVDDFAVFCMPCDVQNDEHLDAVFAKAKEEFGEIDFVLHSIAYAPMEDLKCPVRDVSREGFKMAMEISCYSLISLANRARKILAPGGNILTLTYLGGEKVMPGYNLMGVCKSALEQAVEYLAYDLGTEGFRVNALSAGPLKTLSSSAVGEFDLMVKLYDHFSPLRRNITPAEVGKSGAFLLSDAASGISGENLHVDAGYHIMGGPPPDAPMNW